MHCVHLLALLNFFQNDNDIKMDSPHYSYTNVRVLPSKSGQTPDSLALQLVYYLLVLPERFPSGDERSEPSEAPTAEEVSAEAVELVGLRPRLADLTILAPLLDTGALGDDCCDEDEGALIGNLGDGDELIFNRFKSKLST